MQHRRRSALLLFVAMFSVSLGSCTVLAIQSYRGHLHGFRLWVTIGIAEAVALLVILIVVLTARPNSE